VAPPVTAELVEEALVEELLGLVEDEAGLVDEEDAGLVELEDAGLVEEDEAGLVELEEAGLVLEVERVPAEA